MFTPERISIIVPEIKCTPKRLLHATGRVASLIARVQAQYARLIGNLLRTLDNRTTAAYNAACNTARAPGVGSARARHP